MNKIILATKSPYRKEAFAELGLDFDVRGSEIEEDFVGRPTDPKELVLELSKRKAEDVAKKFTNEIIVGFDSVGYFDGKIQEKPKSREEEVERIKVLSGNTHYFYTGIHIINLENDRTQSGVSDTKINLRQISDNEIEKYLDQDPNFNTYAIGYDPLGHYSMTFPESIEGSYNNYLRGIPVEKIVAMLKEVGYEIK